MALNIDTTAYIEKITMEYANLLQQKILLELAVQQLENENANLLFQISDLQTLQTETFAAKQQVASKTKK